MTGKLFFGTVAACVFAATTAQADVVKVGRSSIELPPGEWHALPSNGGQNTINGAPSGMLPTEDQAFILVLSGRVMAILNVSSSKGGGPRVNWSNTCQSSELAYAASLTSDPNAMECARATGALKTDVYLQRAMPAVLKALNDQGLLPPVIVQSTSATVGNSMGTQLHVNLLAVPSFTGLPGADVVGVPQRVKPAHAAWARELAASIRQSVYSLSGDMKLPSVMFATSIPTSSTSQ